MFVKRSHVCPLMSLFHRLIQQQFLCKYILGSKTYDDNNYFTLVHLSLIFLGSTSCNVVS